jgi:hypothetical protein
MINIPILSFEQPSTNKNSLPEFRNEKLAWWAGA